MRPTDSARLTPFVNDGAAGDSPHTAMPVAVHRIQPYTLIVSVSQPRFDSALMHTL